ncbi:hypothetical protein C0993_007147, partial [Termitomyces sp. T159_Od127]
MDATVVKRLHISGLTPALTSDDISRRLSTFGTVKAIDGFGLPDGLGQPRKFGYATLETTQGQLSRCLNLLSGSTWKGAKLRIGEAKPNFAERLAAEREAASHQPPKKRRRYGGIEAADMSLITPENVATRGGWTVTPLGRILRPMRMRPSHPLPPPKEDKKMLSKGKGGKLKKKVREPDMRARRRTIDMTRYGSVHLKGMFLDMEMMDIGEGQEKKGLEVEVEDDTVESDTEALQEEQEVTAEAETSRTSELAKSVPPLINAHIASLPDNNTDIAAEKKQTLDVLASLFGHENDADWVGRESVDSDMDETEMSIRHRMVVDADDDGDFEVVPMEADATSVPPQKRSTNVMPNEPMDVETKMPVPPTSAKVKQEPTKLKDLFAPREEDAGFSLLGHLDLDLELDDEIPFSVAESHPQESTHSIPTTAPGVPDPYVAPQLNTKLPLFFPHCSPADSGTKARPRDIFDVAMENKWHWRDPAVEFYRMGTEEDIRKRWEEKKVELTREWKKRWREAGKISRRRRI